MNINIADPLKLNRLLQLCSANLPVGGFSFSQGLEYATEMGWVSCQKSTFDWVEMNLNESIAHTDLALLKHLYEALEVNDFARFKLYNQQLIACRESSELRLADVAMGKALIRLLKKLDGVDSEPYNDLFNESDSSFVSIFAIAAYLCKLDLISAQSGYCWTYLDNQVAAATKLVPLGQTQSQNLLFELGEKVAEAINTANSIALDDIGASLPRLAMASAWHETQYTRLFRS
ncbi:urease accessory protein UreF [Psychromonas sp. RZ22]|uniref:urease accessory protein UreF n=1 Tax=Psychromonas algarum TaxID=2555643 RepID=UPI001067B286|nr:urease accessory UreF family protein [Psychromonas sp. RZ22]TEW56810.1 urease accessory protein UreF [Psychromonas sp. RZ22]